MNKALYTIITVVTAFITLPNLSTANNETFASTVQTIYTSLTLILTTKHPTLSNKNFTNQTLFTTNTIVDQPFCKTLHHNLYYFHEKITILWLIIGTFGNLLSLLVLLRHKMRIHSTFTYLMLLAICDTLVIYIGLLRDYLVYKYKFHINNKILCKLHIFSFYFVLHMASWLLVAVNIDRLIASSFLKFSKLWCTPRRALTVSLIIAIILAGINGHFLYYVDSISSLLKLNVTQLSLVSSELSTKSVFEFNFNNVSNFSTNSNNVQYSLNIVDIYEIAEPVNPYVYGECIIDKSVFKSYNCFFQHVFTWIDTTTQVILPFIIMIICNCNIIYKVLLTKKRTKGRNLKRLRKIKGMCIMILTVSIIFFILELPVLIFICLMLGEWIPKDSSCNELLFIITNLMMYTNHVINFFSYCMTGTKFRRELIRLVYCKKIFIILRLNKLNAKNNINVNKTRQHQLINNNQINDNLITINNNKNNNNNNNDNHQHIDNINVIHAPERNLFLRLHKKAFSSGNLNVTNRPRIKRASMLLNSFFNLNKSDLTQPTLLPTLPTPGPSNIIMSPTHKATKASMDTEKKFRNLKKKIKQRPVSIVVAAAASATTLNQTLLDPKNEIGFSLNHNHYLSLSDQDAKILPEQSTLAIPLHLTHVFVERKLRLREATETSSSPCIITNDGDTLSRNETNYVGEDQDAYNQCVKLKPTKTIASSGSIKSVKLRRLFKKQFFSINEHHKFRSQNGNHAKVSINDDNNNNNNNNNTSNSGLNVAEIVFRSKSQANGINENNDMLSRKHSLIKRL